VLLSLPISLSLPVRGATAPLTVSVSDWVELPFSGNVTAGSGNPAYMARINFMREEPGGTGRMWICDLNGNLHVFAADGNPASRTSALLDQAHQQSAYLDFNGRASTTEAAEMTRLPDAGGTTTTPVPPSGLFPLFTKKQGYANGLVTFAFDPGYPGNGRFYTIHIESVSADGDPARLPVTTRFPGFDTTGYTPTAVVAPPAGTASRQAVLIEWTDAQPANSTFEGSARELLRIGYNSHTHPLGDITFDPTARPGDAEWGVMYLASGDGGSGENATLKAGPQRLDALIGKTLRIIPDLGLHPHGSTLSANSRYRIPADNPFADHAAFPGARPEIWTLGHRNPHRFIWCPSAAGTSRSMVAEIGLNGWEEINLLKPGKNYGYSEREGPQKLTISSSAPALGPLPSPDLMPLRLDETTTFPAATSPEYPLLAYPHTADFGDAIANGFFYRGSAIPALQGRFIFADITTGRLWTSRAEDLAAADDGDPSTLAAFEPLALVWDDPHDTAGPATYTRFFEIVEQAYDRRGGIDADLPGGAGISGSGRADIRLAEDATGELYVTSKSDGMIRKLTAPPPPVFSVQPQDEWIAKGGDADFVANAVSQPPPDYRWQCRPAGSSAWQDLNDDSRFSGTRTASLHLETPGNSRSGDHFRCIATAVGAEAVSAEAMLEIRTLPSSWLRTYFNSTERANRAIAGDLSDPDRDGVVNLLEYAFGLDPEEDSSSAMPRAVRDGGVVKLTFPTPRAATLDYQVEASTSLESWSSAGVSIATSGGSTTASYPLAAGPRAFLRVRVTSR
jgi:hypothetical protein